MWVGNVPLDATHDELWRFFNKSPAATPSNDEPHGYPSATGVLSIFLISRSSCAFVNYDSEVYLQIAIARYNGKLLRESAGEGAAKGGAKLVCRMRKREDDLKAGVGGQRGIGLHMKWVKDLKGKSSVSLDSSPSMDSSLGEMLPALDLRLPTGVTAGLDKDMGALSISKATGKQRHQGKGSSSFGSSSGSYGSTNSSVLERYFPKRYFILKSLTQVCSYYFYL